MEIVINLFLSDKVFKMISIVMLINLTPGY